MPRKGEKVSRYSEKEEDIVGEAGDPTVPKMRRIMTLMPVEEQDGESHLKTFAIAKTEGATVSLKAHDGMVEGDPTTAKGSQKWVPRNDAPSDKSTYLSGAGLLPEGGDATFTGGIINNEIPAGASSVVAPTESEGVSSRHPVSREKFNSDIKHQLMKEIRRFGRKYEMLFKLLEEVQGPLDVKIRYFEFTIKEAARFKRYHLIQCLEEKREEILSHSLLSNNNPPLDM